MTMNHPLAFATAGEIGIELRAGRVTAVELAKACLARLDALEPKLNAVIEPMADLALGLAAKADMELGAGHDRGPLHGVPVAIKDIVDIAGQPTSYATRAVEPGRPAVDAELVANLRQAGAVLLAKTNLLEFAYGIVNENLGQTNNPFDLSRTSGGSSGGSVALVCAGIVPLGVGTDTGGSIRIPAAYCGVVGYKPTYGLVPVTGIFPLSWSLDHAGPIARTVADAAYLLSAMTGTKIGLEKLSVSGLRIGLIRQHVMSPLVSDGVRSTLDQAVDVLRHAGAKISMIDLPEHQQVTANLIAILLPEASLAHQSLINVDKAGYAPGTLQQLEQGFKVPAVDYVQAQRFRERLRARLQALFGEVDVLVSPSVSFVAPHEDPAIEGEGGQAEGLASGLANMTGHPAISLPCGLSDGLPVGMQVIGKLGADAALLSTASAIEASLKFTARPNI